MLCLNASSAGRWVYCPLSANVDTAEYATESSEEALEGTKAHELAAYLLDNRVNGTIPSVPAGYDDEMIGHCEEYVSIVTEIPGDIIIEGQYHVPSVHKLNNCRIDAYVYDKEQDTIHIFEFKYGRTPVKPSESYQLINNAVAMLDNFNCKPTTKFALHVVQPRSLSGVISICEIFTMDDIHNELGNLCYAANTAEADPTRAVVGPHCRYCPAVTTCNQLTTAIDSVSIDDIASANLNVNELSDDITRLRSLAGLVKSKLEGLELDAEYRLKKGIQVPNYDLDYGRGRVAWSMDDASIINMGQLFGLDLSKPSTVITPTQAKTLAKTKGIDFDTLSEFTRKTTGELKLIFKPLKAIK